MVIIATFGDPGSGDTWEFDIDWGDGTTKSTSSTGPGSGFEASHQFVTPGGQSVLVCVQDDDHGRDCQTVDIRFSSSPGTITAGLLQWGNSGRGGFNVISEDGESIKGELQYNLGREIFHAHEMTVIAVAPDLSSGWFSGNFANGSSTFVAYLEDNAEPGNDDLFKLWIDGDLITPEDGSLSRGNLQIHDI